jgi:hypothetical protein
LAFEIHPNSNTRQNTKMTRPIECVASEKGYRIDSQGRAFSPRGKQLSASPDSHGYQRFNVTDDGSQRTCWVHRLLDGRHQNNAAENIAIGTRSENLRDTPRAERQAVAQKRWANIEYEERSRRARKTHATRKANLNARKVG